MRILISGGTVVSPTGTQAAEVLVEGERIVAVATSAKEVRRKFYDIRNALASKSSRGT